MEPADNDKFVDRLRSLAVVRSNGMVVTCGGEEDDGGVKIRIKEGSRGGFITGHLLSLNVLNANIRSYPTTVDEDGLTVDLWLVDQSNGRKPTQRLFRLCFWDTMAAKLFFEVYCSLLPGNGPTFEELQSRDLGQGQTNIRNNDNSDDDENESSGEDNIENEQKEDDCNRSVENESGANEEPFSDPFELLDIGNFGESQDMYNPYRM